MATTACVADGSLPGAPARRLARWLASALIVGTALVVVGAVVGLHALASFEASYSCPAGGEVDVGAWGDGVSCARAPGDAFVPARGASSIWTPWWSFVLAVATTVVGVVVAVRLLRRTWR